MTTQFQVRKDQLATTRVVQLPDTPLGNGEVRVRIEHFAYTSNNITYAAFGEAMNYWQFFPVADGAEGWGVVPVWGFGVVEQSRCVEVAEAERLYGYWPMASHAVLKPAPAARCTRSTTTTCAARWTPCTTPPPNRCRPC